MKSCIYKLNPHEIAGGAHKNKYTLLRLTN